MDSIFHEKQEGSLCAQHCLNALLQGEYFTAVDLATLAQQMDEEEKARMAEGGLYSEHYKKFLEQPSGNVDDSGYFSVQVIASALKVWSLELIPFKSQHPYAQNAQRDPTEHNAYICNYRDHWFTVRKIGHQWFNLNSLLSGPDLISNTYLALFLAQLIEEGYSIFMVIGNLPDCTAHKILLEKRVIQAKKPQLLSEMKPAELSQEEKRISLQTLDEDDMALQRTLKLSLENSKLKEDQDLQAALTLSISDFKNETVSNEPSTSRSAESLPQLSSPSSTANEQNCDRSQSSPDEMSEQEMLEIALKMSMES